MSEEKSLKQQFYDYWSKERKGYHKTWDEIKTQEWAKDITWKNTRQWIKEFGSGVDPRTKKVFNNTLEEKIKVIETDNFLKDQVKYLQQQLSQQKKETSLDNEVIKLFKNSIKTYQELPTPYIKPTQSDKQIDEEVVLCLADWHVGDIVSLEETDGINEYNILIARERIAKILESVLSILSIMERGYKFKKLNIFCLGDMVSGFIHEELMQGVAIVDQVMIVGDELTRIIRTLSEYFEKIEVSCVVGNHGRMSKKPVSKKKYDNFDYLAYNFSKIRFSGQEDKIIFDIPTSPMLVKNILGYNFLIRHGDTKVQSYAGIPFYGIKRADSQIKQTYIHFKDIVIHYDILGHNHSQNSLDGMGGGIIMIGSLKGTDEHSLNAYMSGSEPKQYIFGVHKERGKTWHFDLLCK